MVVLLIVVVFLCMRPQVFLCMWLGSNGPDRGPVGHTGSVGLVVGPRASMSLDNVHGQFCSMNLWGCAVSGWIQVCNIFTPCHMVRASSLVGTDDILFIYG